MIFIDVIKVFQQAHKEHNLRPMCTTVETHNAYNVIRDFVQAVSGVLLAWQEVDHIIPYKHLIDNISLHLTQSGKFGEIGV